jgi:hypothetical protein
MSHFKTLAVSMILVMTGSSALAAEGDRPARPSDYELCLQDGLRGAGIPAGMQNIFNPNLYAGKVFLEIKAGCANARVSSAPVVEEMIEEATGTSERDAG